MTRPIDTLAQYAADPRHSPQAASALAGMHAAMAVVEAADDAVEAVSRG